MPDEIHCLVISWKKKAANEIWWNSAMAREKKIEIQF